MDRALLDQIDATARGIEGVVVAIGRKRSRLFLPVPALMILFAEPTGGAVPFGLALVTAGSLLRLWAAGYLTKNSQLTTAGPYAYLRHPLYLGMLMIVGGWCTLVGWLPWGLALGAYSALLYLCAIVLEERRLRFLFPDYADYRQQVPLFLPLRRYASPTGQFRWQRVWGNNEPQILGWNLLITLLILLRGML